MRRSRVPAPPVLLVCLVVVAAACGSGGDAEESDDAPSASEAADVDDAAPGTAAVASDPPATDSVVEEPATTTVAATDPPPVTEPTASGDDAGSAGERAVAVVATLASDDFMGRDDLSEGSTLAQDFLVSQLAEFTDNFGATDTDPVDAYRQDYGDGVNLIGIIPGGDLADEYVMIGAHYDHLGTECRNITDDDTICNGASDNATGVAAALEVARVVAAAGPRRSVVVALWDGEEDGLVGSARYVDDAVVPLAQTVAYINFDIQGSNLVPSLASSTVMVGAETGGQQLIDAALAATDESPLATANFSIIFGQGRSDHANLAGAGVPSVFFTDANNGCYHTVKDDLDAVDFGKLDLQIANATNLALDLVDTDTPPVFAPDAPLTVHNDAVELLELVAAAEPDFAQLGIEGEEEAIEFLAALEAIVAAGPDAYDDAAIGQVLGGAANFVDRLANSECRPAS